MTGKLATIGVRDALARWGSAAPPRVEDYFPRPEIEARLAPLSRRLTVLRAPCGFGKTSLLSAVCLRERENGTGIVWISCDANLTAETLIDRLIRDFGGNPSGRPFTSLHASVDVGEKKFAPDVGQVFGVIEKSVAPWLIVFDDVERLGDADTAKVVDAICRYGPPNLHAALAMRTNSANLDLATPILTGQGEILDVEDLRFSDPEIAQFIAHPLSREELISLSRNTEGWPVALRLIRNERRKDEDMVARHLLARLTRGLSDSEREYLLDLATFDTIELPRLEASFPGEHARCWPPLWSALRGLIRPVDSSEGTLRLHPLVRKLLRERRQAENLDRFRRVNRRFAKTVLRGGDFGTALLHAAQANDHALCARVLEKSGGLEQLFKEGLRPFVSASRYLTQDLADQHPQLVPTRCLALVIEGNVVEARRVYKRFRASAEPLRQTASDYAVRVRQAEDTAIRVILWSFSCQSLADCHFTRLLSEATRYSDEDGLPAIYRGAMFAVQAVADSIHGRFELGRRRSSRAKKLFRMGQSTQGISLIDLQSGVSAMAQGRVGEAKSCYSKSIVEMREMASPLALELRIECNDRDSRWARDGDGQADPRLIPGWIDIRGAVHGNLAEIRYEEDGPRGAVDILEASIDWADEHDAPCLKRLLCAQRVQWLVRAGDADEARRAWAAADLPENLDSILTLSRQSWREMEAIACARIALLGALGALDAARDLADHLRITALGWGLKRPLMRCLASWSALETRAANTAAANRLLNEYVHEYAGTPYSRPLSREGDASIEGLRALLREELDATVRSQALALLEALDDTDLPGQATPAPDFSRRELEILEGLARGRRNKEIARALGLSESGVRYHLQRIYQTLGANGRIDAVRRASHLGVDVGGGALPPRSPDHQP
ncbi:MAG: LuxR C-terminal-related transcriptional regulator, partial [Gammaproteobacteria bacterium]|nr:LuxR C-terminal-related transcriptional regulator [Gammaproteobacteria bacterium]